MCLRLFVSFRLSQALFVVQNGPRGTMALNIVGHQASNPTAGHSNYLF